MYIRSFLVIYDSFHSRLIDAENKLSAAEEKIEQLEGEKVQLEEKLKRMEGHLEQSENQNGRIKEEYQKSARDLKDLIQKLQEAGNELERIGQERDETRQLLEVAVGDGVEKDKMMKQMEEKSNGLFKRLDQLEGLLKGRIFGLKIVEKFVRKNAINM